MMLTEKEIEKNKNTFKKVNEKHQFLPQKFVDEKLGDQFFRSPATVSTDWYNCCEGGLVDHILRMTKYGYHFNEQLPADLRYDIKVILKCCVVAEMGKMFMFEHNDNDWERNKRGMLYKFTNDNVSLKATERGCYYVLKNGISLTEEEYQAILTLGKNDFDKLNKITSNPLSVLLRNAQEWAIIESKTKDRNEQYDK